jgi:pyrophosphatase PpaX
MTIRTVLFDLDGTLIDSIALILASYHHTLATHGLPPVADAEWLRGVGTPLRVQLGPWARNPEELEKLVATYRSYNLEHHDRMVTVFPGVAELLRRLGGAGFRLGVVTSKTREGTLRGLALAGIEPWFEVLVCADDVMHPKPHRQPVDHALAALAAEPSSALFVGDSIHDLQSGRAAGVRTGAALWGPFPRAALEPGSPDYWFDTPSALEGLLLRETAIP